MKGCHRFIFMVHSIVAVIRTDLCKFQVRLTKMSKEASNNFKSMRNKFLHTWSPLTEFQHDCPSK